MKARVSPKVKELEKESLPEVKPTPEMKRIKQEQLNKEEPKPSGLYNFYEKFFNPYWVQQTQKINHENYQVNITKPKIERYNNPVVINTDEEIKEEIIEHESPLKSTSKLENSNEDGLINWALNLPDEMSHSHSSHLFKNS